MLETLIKHKVQRMGGESYDKSRAKHFVKIFRGPEIRVNVRIRPPKFKNAVS
jgi:hypothetical protein